MVERAFAAWGQATGLTFVEQSSPRNADIEVGWGDFDTAQSGVLGLTTTNASDGELQPGAEIRLEDPSDTALTLNSSGELSYSGTSATLYQVLLHEIGHAIGLGDSNDPSSVMYAVAGPTDASISSVDVGAVETLYRLTQAMSAMPSAGGASINEGAWVAPTPMLTPVAANAHAPHLMVA
jgi:predicted Zn-dependent protease